MPEFKVGDVRYLPVMDINHATDSVNELEPETEYFEIKIIRKVVAKVQPPVLTEVKESKKINVKNKINKKGDRRDG